jgi:hypothetical protein
MTIPVALVCLTAIVLYAMRLYERRGARQVLKLTDDLAKLDERLVATARDLETVRAVGLANGVLIDVMDKGLKGHAQTLNTLAMARGTTRPG